MRTTERPPGACRRGGRGRRPFRSRAACPRHVGHGARLLLPALASVHAAKRGCVCGGSPSGQAGGDRRPQPVARQPVTSIAGDAPELAGGPFVRPAPGGRPDHRQSGVLRGQLSAPDRICRPVGDIPDAHGRKPQRPAIDRRHCQRRRRCLDGTGTPCRTHLPADGPHPAVGGRHGHHPDACAWPPRHAPGHADVGIHAGGARARHLAVRTERPSTLYRGPQAWRFRMGCANGRRVGSHGAPTRGLRDDRAPLCIPSRGSPDFRQWPSGVSRLAAHRADAGPEYRPLRA